MAEASNLETSRCVNCKLNIEDNKYFRIGNDKWHLKCFECYQCHDILDTDKEFLRIGDDRNLLICKKCLNYECSSCGEHIANMAIILSNDEAYCKKCFKCFRCDTKINGLKYAKTKRGLLCINCHEELKLKKQQIEMEKRRDQLELKEHNRSRSLDTYSSNLVIPKRSTRRPVSPSRHIILNKTKNTNAQEEVQPNEMSIENSFSSENVDTVPSQSLVDFKARRVSSHVKSNSESVIPQFLPTNETNAEPEASKTANSHLRTTSIDDMLNSTLENFDFDEIAKIRNTSTIYSPVLKESTSENDSVLTNDEKNILVSPKRHGIIVGNKTTAENKQDNASSVHTSHSSNYENSSDYQLKESNEKEIFSKFRTPVGSIDITNAPINSPIAVNQEKFKGGLTTDLKLNNRYDLGDEQSQSSGLAINVPHLSNDEYKHQKNSSLSGTTSNDHELDDKIYDFSMNLLMNSATTNSNSSSNSEQVNKKTLSRSLSKMSRNLVSNFKSKTSSHSKLSDGVRSKRSDTSRGNDDFDTHSGWGVSPQRGHNDSPSNEIQKTPSEIRHSSRGKSDSTIYSAKRLKDTSRQTDQTPGSGDHDDTYTHLRSNSNVANSALESPASAPRAAFQTPVSDSSNMFTRYNATPSTSEHHYRKSSLQGLEHVVREEDSTKLSLAVSNLANGATLDPSDVSSPTGDLLAKELAEADLNLRRMKLELRTMESTRSRLSNEIDSLKKQRDFLKNEVDQLQTEKGNFPSSPESRIEDGFVESELHGHFDGLTPKKQTNSVHELSQVNNSNSKSKFWKIFSSDGSSAVNSPQQMHNNKISPQVPSKKMFGNSLKSPGSRDLSKMDISEPINLKANAFTNPIELSTSNTNSLTQFYSNANSISGENLYGSLLVRRCTYEGSMVPLIVSTCIMYIERSEKNMKIEGIYRKSGSQTLIEEIEKEFQAVRSRDEIHQRLKDLLNSDINAVTNVLKRYLRKLPNPLIPFEVYEPLIEIVRSNNLLMTLPNKEVQNEGDYLPLYETILSSFQKSLNLIPVEHYVLLRVLSTHVYKISKYSDWNLMTLSNLAIVFSPNIIHDLNGEKDVSDMKLRNYVTEFIFKNHENLFL